MRSPPRSGCGSSSPPGYAQMPSPISWRLGHIAPAVVIALLTIVGAAATITASFGGLYWLAAAMAVATTSGLINSWVLLVEIKR